MKTLVIGPSVDECARHPLEHRPIRRAEPVWTRPTIPHIEPMRVAHGVNLASPLASVGQDGDHGTHAAEKAARPGLLEQDPVRFEAR